MAGHGFWQRMWLTRLSKPAAERELYRHVIRARPARILELGLGTLSRTERMLRAAAGRSAGGVHYVGLDRFEGRTEGDPPGVSLKEAHRRLHAIGRVQLVPGNADTALARLCNHLGTFDLVVVSADNDERHLERCWFFLQRLIRIDTTVFAENRRDGATTWGIVSRSRIDELATRTVQPGIRRAG